MSYGARELCGLTICLGIMQVSVGVELRIPINMVECHCRKKIIYVCQAHEKKKGYSAN